MSEDIYLVTAEEIEGMAGLAKAHFLNPNARRVNKSLGDLTGLTGIGIHIIEVEPGCETTEFHVHQWEDECVYILAGTGTARIGARTVAVKPGDFLGYRKRGLAHTIVNTGAETLRCLVIGERLPHDVADYPDKAKRIFRDEGMTWNLVDREAIEEVRAGAKK